jgi:hypothetical protein
MVLLFHDMSSIDGSFVLRITMAVPSVNTAFPGKCSRRLSSPPRMKNRKRARLLLVDVGAASSELKHKKSLLAYYFL